MLLHHSISVSFFFSSYRCFLVQVPLLSVSEARISAHVLQQAYHQVKAPLLALDPLSGFQFGLPQQSVDYLGLCTIPWSCISISVVFVCFSSLFYIPLEISTNPYAFCVRFIVIIFQNSSKFMVHTCTLTWSRHHLRCKRIQHKVAEWRARQHDFLATLKPSAIVARRLASLRRAVRAAQLKATTWSSQKEKDGSTTTSSSSSSSSSAHSEASSWIGVHVRRDDLRVRIRVNFDCFPSPSFILDVLSESPIAFRCPYCAHLLRDVLAVAGKCTLFFSRTVQPS